MERRVWNKNSGDKIPNKFKGETCWLHEGPYGTFTAEQGKTQWPWTSFLVLYFYEKNTLKSCLLLPQINALCLKKQGSESTANVYTHQWFLQKDHKAWAAKGVPWKLKHFCDNIWPTLWPSLLSCFTTDLAYSILDPFSISLSRNREAKLNKVMLLWIRFSVHTVAKDWRAFTRSLLLFTNSFQSITMILLPFRLRDIEKKPFKFKSLQLSIHKIYKVLRNQGDFVHEGKY